MVKNAEKKMCWNCDATVSMHFASCPYCGVDLSVEPPPEARFTFDGKSVGNPFQKAPQYREEIKVAAIQDPNQADQAEEEDSKKVGTQEILSFLLLLPGALLMLFALFILFFSNQGMLTLQWSQTTSYFYFITSLPLLYLGWKISR
jgi:hypothetical protein